jgi:hypothetical protein
MSLIMINGNQLNLKEQPSIKAADGNASQSNYIYLGLDFRASHAPANGRVD